MFKKIPGNHNYIVSLNSQLCKSNGTPSDLPITDDFLFINLYGFTQRVSLSWLALIAHFEIKLPESFLSITFTDCNPVVSASNCGKIVCFKRPIVVNRDFRVIPNYSDYAISKEGVLLDLETNKTFGDFSMDRDYPMVSIYDPDRAHVRKVLVHRLVALAWVKNPDVVGKPIVNHKDGNKKNYHCRNLEWCSYSENNTHAVVTGLRNDSRKFKVRDIKENTVKHYDSFRQVCLDVGLHETTKYKDKIYQKRTKIVKNRYEIKELNDLSPWVTDAEAAVKKSRYTIKLTYPNGSEQLFYTIVDVMRRLKIWNISYNIAEIVKVAATKHPDIKIEVTDNFETREIQALRLSDGKVFEAKRAVDLSRELGVGQSTIVAALKSSEQYDCKGFVFRYKSDKQWDSSYKRHPNAPKVITGRNAVTGETTVFPSLEAVVSTFNTTYHIAKSRIENGLPLGDWELKENLTLL